MHKLNNFNVPVNDKILPLLPQTVLPSKHLFDNLIEPQLLLLNFHKDFITLDFSKINNTIFTDLKYSLLEESPFESFLFLRNSTVTSFFMTSSVDMPISLKKSKSLYVKTFEIQSLKLSNLLMRDGKRGLIIKTLTQALNTLTLKWTSLIKPLHPTIGWLELYYSLANTNLNKNFLNSMSGWKDAKGVLGKGLIEENRWRTEETNFFKNILIERFEDFHPLFNFYIQKTDKSKVKNSRGKVSKLKLLWKYVPPYKRFYQALRWLLKDLKFQKSNSFTLRLLNVFETFCLTPQLSFLWKLRNFVHFYVFRNFKKTLLRTLRSSS